MLLVDCDPQASLTLSLGMRTGTLLVTLATLMGRVLQEYLVHAREEAILSCGRGGL